MKKFYLIAIFSLIIGFLIPLIKSEFIYWDFLELSTKIFANYILIIGLTLIILIIGRVILYVSSKKEKVKLDNLFYKSWIIAVLLFVVTMLFSSCVKEKEHKFKPSFKEIKSNKKELLEYFDTIHNVYSNFKYNIAFQVPKNWKFDKGITEHSIMRAQKRDSLFYFSINVIETNYNVEKNFWKTYQTNKTELEKKQRKALESTINSKIQNYESKTSYLRNRKTIKREYTFEVKHQDYVFEYKGIMHQTPIDNYTYTFGLTLPKIFYDLSPEQHHNLFDNIEFLKNKNDIKKITYE